jgi:E3 ubiquitin-protein ligase HUWE1
VSDEDEEMGDMGPIEGLPGDGVDVEVILDGEEIEDMGSDGEDDSDGEDIGDEDSDEEDVEDDEDEDEDMDDLEELEEITADDENASLAEDVEGSWSGEEGDFGDGADLMPEDLPPALGFVLDRDPQQMIDQIDQIRQLEGDLDDFMEDEMQEEDGVYFTRLISEYKADFL